MCIETVAGAQAIQGVELYAAGLSSSVMACGGVSIYRGAVGTLFILAALFGSMAAVGMKAYRAALGLFCLAIGVFIFRSLFSLFYGSSVGITQQATSALGLLM